MTSISIKPDRTSKSPANRLLDLLGGWANFVSVDEENAVSDAGLSAEEIADLYQAAGAASMDWEQLSEGEQSQAVQEFLTRRVLPLLLRPSSATRVQTQAA